MKYDVAPLGVSFFVLIAVGFFNSIFLGIGIENLSLFQKVGYLILFFVILYIVNIDISIISKESDRTEKELKDRIDILEKENQVYRSAYKDMFNMALHNITDQEDKDKLNEMVNELYSKLDSVRPEKIPYYY